MKRHMMRRRLIRPADALLPLALATAALLGHGAAAVRLFVCLWGARLLGLSTAGSLPMAFARQPSMRDVQGSVKCALLMQLVGAALAACGLRLLGPEWFKPEGLSFLGAGLLLDLEQVFYEYLYAAGDGSSAGVSRLITAALTFAGLCLSGTLPAAPAIAAAAALLASAAVALVIGGGLKGKINLETLACAPSGLLRDALYPAAFAALALLLPRYAPDIAAAPTLANPLPWDASFFIGLAAYSLCRSPFRRTKSEARPMNVALLVTLAVSLAITVPALLRPELLSGMPGLNGYRPTDLPVLGAAVLLACLCGFALFGNAGRER